MKDRIILLSPSGWGNQGDNAILRGLTREIGEAFPDVSIVLATLNPIESARGFGCPAVPLRGVRIPDHWIDTFAVARPTSHRPRADTPGSSGPAATGDNSARALLRRFVPDPVRRFLSTVVRSPRRIVLEVRFFFRVLSWLRRARGVVVAGGGQLDADWGGDFGHPLTLALWALAAEVRRVPFAVLSVGAGGLESRLGQRFVRSALGRAAHVSVRDSRTRDLVGRITGRRPHFSPDLAFLLRAGSRPEDHTRKGPKGPTSMDEIRVVGLSPMAYAKPGSWPVADPAVYHRICRAMAEAGATWLRQGAELDLFTTCSMDVATAEEVKERIASLAPEYEGSVSMRSIGTPEEVLSVLSEVDVVVAARLHGVILAQVAGKPVIAVSHHWKVLEQMSMAGHERFVFEPASVTASGLTEAMDRMRLARRTVEREVERFTSEAGAAVRSDVRRALALFES